MLLRRRKKEPVEPKSVVEMRYEHLVGVDPGFILLNDESIFYSLFSGISLIVRLFIFYAKASTSALATILCSIMCGSKWPLFKVCK